MSLCNKGDRNDYILNEHTGLLTTKLIQIHLGLSPLRENLFKYNISDNPFCPVCFVAVESTFHFFGECPIYAVHRDQLRFDIINVMRSAHVETNIDLYDNKQVVKFICTGLSKDNIISHNICADNQRADVNKQLWKLAVHYMYLTRRFTVLTD
jgi:hypothetical protein